MSIVKDKINELASIETSEEVKSKKTTYVSDLVTVDNMLDVITSYLSDENEQEISFVDALVMYTKAMILESKATENNFKLKTFQTQLNRLKSAMTAVCSSDFENLVQHTKEERTMKKMTKMASSFMTEVFPDLLQSILKQ